MDAADGKAYCICPFFERLVGDIEVGDMNGVLGNVTRVADSAPSDFNVASICFIRGRKRGVVTLIAFVTAVLIVARWDEENTSYQIYGKRKWLRRCTDGDVGSIDREKSLKR